MRRLLRISLTFSKSHSEWPIHIASVQHCIAIIVGSQQCFIGNESLLLRDFFKYWCRTVCELIIELLIKSLRNRTLRIEHLVYTFILGRILYHLNTPILIELEGQFIAWLPNNCLLLLIVSVERCFIYLTVKIWMLTDHWSV